MTDSSHKKPASRPATSATHNMQAQLEAQLDEADWSWLQPHLQRDAIILVASELNLVTVGIAIASDAAVQVQTWISVGQIGKPTPIQVDTWNQSPTKKFIVLVVQPYVLIQELIVH